MSIISRMTKYVLALVVISPIGMFGSWSAAAADIDAIQELNRQGKWATAREEIGGISTSDQSAWIPAQEILTRIEYLEGHIEACHATAKALVKAQPDNATAKWFLVACALRMGEYERANALTKAWVDAETHPILAHALHADVLEATGDFESATAARRSVIPMLNEAQQLDVMNLVAGARALRCLGEFEAANQCIQLAQDMDITDPFMKLEKIRLYRATQGYAIAEKSAFQMTKSYASIPMAYAEWADVKWDMRTKEEDVAALCSIALKGDPTLLDARCRLMFYALLKDDFTHCEELIQQNLDINALHRRTHDYQRAARYLNSDELGTLDEGGSATFADLMVDLMTAKNDYAQSLKWAKAYAEAEPESPFALYKLGLATFRSGNYPDSQSLLEQSLSAFPFALQTRNLLDYLDGVAKNASTGGGKLLVSHPTDESALGQFAVTRGNQILEREAARLSTTYDQPLHIQLCSNLNDLAVITEGIPFGCCVDPAHPATTGVVRFGDTVFLWTPEAAGAARPNYRWDEALHRGIVQAVVREATSGNAPKWLEEGYAAYAVFRENTEWAPANLGYVVDALAHGVPVSVAGLGEGFLGSRRPYYDVYAPLLIEDWTERYGDAAMREFFAEIARGTAWAMALEQAFDEPIDRINDTSKASIVKRYATLLESAEPAMKSASALFDVAAYERAAIIVIGALHGNPYDPSCQNMVLDLLERLDVGPDKSDAYFRLLEAALPVRRSDADARFQLANWHRDNDQHDRALELCRSAVGIRPEWLAAHRLLADTALELGKTEAAYPSLATLHAARPKHVKTLERLIVCARELNLTEDAMRWSEALESIAPNSKALSKLPRRRGDDSAAFTPHTNARIN